MKPTVSVVVMAHGRGPRLATCLRSLQRQDTGQPYELLVVLNPADPQARSAADLPGIRWIELREQLNPGQARNAGWLAAQGDVVAFLMANCTAAPCWLEGLADEHRRRPGHPIGGPVRPPDGARAVQAAAYFCELGTWPLSSEGYVDDWPICNLSYPRTLLESAGGFSASAGGSDRELHERLRASSAVRIWVSPRPAVTYHPIERLGELLGHEFRRGRLYADLRATRTGVSRPVRALRALAWWLLPGVFLLRGLRSTRRDLRARLLFLRSLHVLLLGWTARALGDAAGLLQPPGRTGEAV